MSQQNSEKRIQEDSTDIEEFGEFQSPKIKRIPTKYVNPTPIKSPFKRRIALDDIDEDLPQSIKKKLTLLAKFMILIVIVMMILILLNLLLNQK